MHLHWLSTLCKIIKPLKDLCLEPKHLVSFLWRVFFFWPKAWAIWIIDILWLHFMIFLYVLFSLFEGFSWNGSGSFISSARVCYPAEKDHPPTTRGEESSCISWCSLSSVDASLVHFMKRIPIWILVISWIFKTNLNLTGLRIATATAVSSHSWSITIHKTCFSAGIQQSEQMLNNSWMFFTNTSWAKKDQAQLRCGFCNQFFRQKTKAGTKKTSDIFFGPWGTWVTPGKLLSLRTVSWWV